MNAKIWDGVDTLTKFQQKSLFAFLIENIGNTVLSSVQYNTV